MLIDDAIKMLRAEKKRGVKHIIIAHWTADQFGRSDDKIWDFLADAVMDADWSDINTSLDDMVEEVLIDQDLQPEGKQT